MNMNFVFANLKEVLSKLETYNKIYTSLWCIILEATAPLYRQKTNDYITKLKVIDQTINPSLNNSYQQCTVYLFSDQKSNLSFCKIGDIIHLQKFSFYEWNDIIFESKPQKQGRFSVFNRQEGNFVLNKTDSQKLETFITFDQTNRMSQLHQWFVYKFLDTFKFKVGIELLDQKSVKILPFNFILKISNIMHTENEQIKRYVLEDNEKNMYTVAFFESLEYQIGRNVCLSQIKAISQQFQIQKTDTTNMMVIPIELILESPYQYRAVYRDSFRIKSNKLAIQESKHLTIIKKQSNYQKQIQSLSFLEEIMEMTNYYEKNMKMKFSNKKHRIHAYVIKVTSYFKLFYEVGNFLVDQNFLLEFPDEAVKYIYQIRFEIKDLSIQLLDKTFELFLFSWDENGKDFFPNVSLDGLNRLLKENKREERMLLEQQLKQKLNVWYEYLIKKSYLNNVLELIIEPLVSQKSIKYRIVDTSLTEMKQ